MNFSDSDAQRLINLIDERIEQRLRQERPRFGIVTQVDAPAGLCSAYLDDSISASPYIRYPTYMRPAIGDVVLVKAGGEGERVLIDIFRTPGTGSSTNLMDGRLRLTNSNDATLSSANHAFQIGDGGAANIAADDNEIMARNNGATAPLHLNAEGGPVRVNANAGTGSGNGVQIGPSAHGIFEESAGFIGTLATFFADGFRSQEATDAHAATDSYTTYPEGLSWFVQNTQSASGWPTADARGVVITLVISGSTLYHYQFWLERGTIGGGDSLYWRSWNNGGPAWNAWVLIT